MWRIGLRNVSSGVNQLKITYRGLGGTPVEVFLDYLRKDRDEGAQTNSGVVVTKMAMSERYRDELVRAHRGFESLHQIHAANKAVYGKT